ncbi:DNA-binding protein, partial [Acinetobacter baumannii]
NIFSLNNDELAAALGVTRKTLLSWRKEDSSPKKAQSLKLFNLYVLAKNWKDNNYSTHKSDLDLPVLNGKSIKSMIAEDSLDVDKILFAGNRLSHNILVEDDLF